MIALDTETTGLDVHHAARPFFVTIAFEDGSTGFWEWAVDPLTREVAVEAADLDQIMTLVNEADEVVMQNGKFDVAALASIGIHSFPWEKVQDTLIAGHLLATNHRHNLTDMVIEYLGEDIEHYERELRKVCQECRRMARSQFPNWMIAEEGLPGLPSVKKSGGKTTDDKAWKNDSWLPRAIAERCGCQEDHPYRTVLPAYANADSAWTLRLWLAMRPLLEQRGLWAIYRERMKLYPLTVRMENRGVTVSAIQHRELTTKYGADAEQASDTCLEIAAKYCYDLRLPKAGNNGSLTRFIFDVLKLPVVGETDSGNPSCDKDAIDYWLDTLPQESGGHQFLTALKTKRKKDTSLQYLRGYERFWLPWQRYDSCGHCKGVAKQHEGNWFVLHPSLNPTSTDTLRWGSTNPNEQNVSKAPDNEGFSLRACFGPAPGREWWKADYSNIELRIPAYEANEQEQVRIFEKPNDPPYFGSYHLAVFDALHPELFREHGAKCKDVYAATWYQWVKNGNFARQYGAQRETADRSYHKDGAFDLLRDRYPAIAELNDRWVAYANHNGYVETLPDKDVDPVRGYPILCSRSNYGRVVPTVPLCYHVSGTAMQTTNRAMVKCEAKLEEWRGKGFDGWTVMQVHDELVFDFPKSRIAPSKSASQSNLWRARILAKLMASCGDSLIPRIPTPVELTYCPENWSRGEKFSA